MLAKWNGSQNQTTGSCLTYFVKFFAETEVCEDDVALGVQEDVLQLQVPVNNPQLRKGKDWNEKGKYQIYSFKSIVTFFWKLFSSQFKLLPETGRILTFDCGWF